MIFIKRILVLLILGLCQSSFADAWLTQALKLQREIDLNAPLSKATFLGSHNSYNSRAYQIIPLRYLDPNQTLSIYDQLNAGVRSVELDAHWTWGNILLCHAHDNHFGCSPFDRRITEGLEEIHRWLQANPNELVLLYIERHLNGHETLLAEMLESTLGDYIYKPANATCTSLLGTISKADVLKTGKQLLIVTQGCEPSFPAWNNLVFAGIGPMDYTFPEMPPKNFTDFPDCGKSGDFKRDPLHQSMWHLYEDRTLYKNFPTPKPKIEEHTVREMVKCGVNWHALDKLIVSDKRLAAAIWSWARDYPKPDAGDCAVYKNKIGFVNYPCETTVPAFACKNKKTEELRAVSIAGMFDDGDRACKSKGADWNFIVPINGAELNMLKSSISTPEVWVNYKKNINEVWVSN